MPIFDIICPDCGFEGEIITGAGGETVCPSCGSFKAKKCMSATSSLTGKPGMGLPGPGDTGCCGSSPGHAGCAGPGTCCGKNHG